MTQYLRAYCERAAGAATAEPGTPIRFTASTENVARDGLVIEASGWDLENFQRNPVFLWAHDMMGARPPIGRVAKVFTKSKQLVADVEFDQDDDFARSIESKYRNGYLNAVSVSWDTREFAPPKAQGAAPRITKAELLEISGVPVPSDPGALAQRQARALRDLATELEELANDQLPDPEDAGTLYRIAGRPFANEHACRLRDPGDFEDGSFRRTQRESDGKRYSIIMGKLKGEDTLTEQSYRYPKDDWTVSEARAHCRDHDGIEFEPAKERADDPTPDTDAWEDAAAAMCRLFLPGERLTERERRRDYHKLSKQYRLANREAPEWIAIDDLVSFTLAEIRGLFLEGEPDLFPELFRAPASGQRAGAVLSKRNRDDIQQSIGLLNGVLRRAEKEAEQAQEAENEPERGLPVDDLDQTLADLFALQGAA